jgi:hypothetical protein
MFCNLYNTSCHYLQSIVYNDKRLHMKEKKRKEKKHFVACSLSLSVFFRERKPFQISLRSSGEVTAAVWCPHGLIWPSSWSWRPWFLTASSGGLHPLRPISRHFPGATVVHQACGDGGAVSQERSAQGPGAAHAALSRCSRWAILSRGVELHLLQSPNRFLS